LKRAFYIIAQNFGKCGASKTRPKRQQKTPGKTMFSGVRIECVKNS